MSLSICVSKYEYEYYCYSLYLSLSWFNCISLFFNKFKSNVYQYRHRTFSFAKFVFLETNQPLLSCYIQFIERFVLLIAYNLHFNRLTIIKINSVYFHPAIFIRIILQLLFISFNHFYNFWVCWLHLFLFFLLIVLVSVLVLVFICSQIAICYEKSIILINWFNFWNWNSSHCYNCSPWETKNS